MGLRKFARTRKKGGAEGKSPEGSSSFQSDFKEVVQNVMNDRAETGRRILEDLKYKTPKRNLPKRTLKNRLHHFYQKLPNVSGRTRRFFQPKLQRQFENLEELEPVKTPTWRKLYRRLFGTKPSNGNKL